MSWSQLCDSHQHHCINFPYQPSALTFHINLPHQPSVSIFRINLPHQPSASTFRINLPYQPSASTFRINFPHQPSALTFRINFPHQPSASIFQIYLSDWHHLLHISYYLLTSNIGILIRIVSPLAYVVATSLRSPLFIQIKSRVNPQSSAGQVYS